MPKGLCLAPASKLLKVTMRFKRRPFPKLLRRNRHTSGSLVHFVARSESAITIAIATAADFIARSLSSLEVTL